MGDVGRGCKVIMWYVQLPPFAPIELDDPFNDELGGWTGFT